jgi:hypothetical protein
VTDFQPQVPHHPKYRAAPGGSNQTRAFEFYSMFAYIKHLPFFILAAVSIGSHTSHGSLKVLDEGLLWDSSQDTCAFLSFLSW